MRDQAVGKEKCDKLILEDYEKKEYMSEQSIEGVRQYFYSRVRMQPFAGNYSKDKRFMKSNWLRKCRNEREEESHLMSGSWEVYGDIWNSYGQLDNDEELVQFFDEVLERRDMLEEEA